MLETALAYLDRGWSVFPCLNKKPLVDWKEFQSAKPTLEQVRKWWTEWPNAWIGVALGEVSGIVRLDADSAEGQSRAHTLGLNGCGFRTPSGGHGWLLKYETWMEALGGAHVFWKGEGEHRELRLQSTGAYTILPASPGYCWDSNVHVTTTPKEARKALHSAALNRVLSRLERELAPTIAVPAEDLILEALNHLSNERADDRDAWIRVGFALHSASDQYLTHWIEWSRKSPKFKEGECEKLWAGFRRSGGLTARTLLYWAKEDGWKPSKSVHEPLTDVGNGKVFARMAVDKFLYAVEAKRWLSWDGRRWTAKSGNVLAEDFAKEVVRKRFNAAFDSLKRARDKQGDEESIKRKVAGCTKVIKWAIKSEDARHINGAVRMARSEEGMHVLSEQFDQHPYLLNLQNGTYDLKAHVLRQHDPADCLTQLAPVGYDPSAICPRWMRWLDEVFEGDTELISWLKRWCGYCLTGDTNLAIMPVWFGHKRNGKSTFARVFYLWVLGPDYSCTLPEKFFAVTRNEQHPARLKVAYKKRVVFDLETDDAMKLNAALLKRLTGNDQMQVRGMFENFSTDTSTAKYVIATNHRPKVPEGDDAVWARLVEVPFNVCFEGREETGLDEKLKEEAPGILNWMLEGLKEFQSDGLGERPRRVEEATESNKQEQDTVSRWFEEMCMKEEGAELKKSDATASYETWCRRAQNGVSPVNGKRFGGTMKRLGINVDAGNRKYVGVKLVT